MKFQYLLLLFVYFQNCHALESETKKTIRVKGNTFICSFNIQYEKNTCFRNSTVSCSPDKKRSRTAKNVVLELNDGTKINIKKLKISRKKDKIIKCEIKFIAEGELEQSSCSFNDEELVPSQRSPLLVPSQNFVWPKGIIPYVFTSTVIPTDRAVFEANMRQIQERSCFRFKRYDDPPSGRKYLEIDIPSNAKSCMGRDGGSYWSAVVYDRIRTKNAILLHSSRKLTDKWGCRGKISIEGGMLHEMFHALGVGHTHKRKDRAKYVTVNEDNILPGEDSQYSICRNCQVYGPYECNSIMHYGYATKGYSNRRTMYANNPRTCTIDRNIPSIPTSNDWKLIQRIANKECGNNGGTTCCSRVNLSSRNWTGFLRGNFGGRWTATGRTINGKSQYKHSNSRYCLWFSTSRGQWMSNTCGFSGTSSYILGDGPSGMKCPWEATRWQFWNGNRWITDNTMKATCD